MSDFKKKDGAKIAIKFDKPLIGDVSGNEQAFKVKWKQYEYVGGPLIDKEVQPASVERYGYPIVWIWEESLKLESTEEQVIESFESETIHPALTLTGTWTRSTKTAYDGAYSLESSNKNHSSESNAYLRWNSQTGKTFSIAYRVSSESGFDKFYLYHNGTVVVNGISGDQPWAVYTGITTEGQNEIRARYTKDGSVSRNLDAGFIDYFVFDALQYETQRIEEFEPIALAGQYRFRQTANMPEGTSILIEYTTGAEQGEWNVVNDGDIITADTNVWFRVTLSTTNNQVTPELTKMWLEETEESQDIIRLVMPPLNRFYNAEGEITVEYDMTKGNLAGQYGLVQSFSESFTPEGLQKIPNPGHREHISAIGNSLSVNFICVSYEDGYFDEHISVTGTALTIDLIDASTITP